MRKLVEAVSGEAQKHLPKICCLDGFTGVSDWYLEDRCVEDICWVGGGPLQEGREVFSSP